MGGEEVKKYLSWLPDGWQAIKDDGPEWSRQDRTDEARKIHKEFIFKSFREGIQFVKEVADLAEKENHHPDIFIFYNRVIIELWTHAIGGLSENDFILAAKIEVLSDKY